MTFGIVKQTARTFSDGNNVLIRLPKWASEKLGWSKGMELVMTFQGGTLLLGPSQGKP